MDTPFPGGYGRGVGGSPNSTQKNMPDRLDKWRSALAEAQLKIFTELFFTETLIEVKFQKMIHEIM